MCNIKILARSVFLNNFKIKISSGYPLNHIINITMIPLTSSPVDKAHLRFIYNEDLYLIKEKKIISETEKSLSVQEPPIDSIERKSNKRETSLKIGIVVGSEKEISENKDFLTKILKAVSVSWEEAGVISKNDSYEITAFESYIIFGTAQQSLIPFHSPIVLNQVFIQNNKKIIFTYSLSELEKSKDKKKGLWDAMQIAYLK